MSDCLSIGLDFDGIPLWISGHGSVVEAVHDRLGAFARTVEDRGAIHIQYLIAPQPNLQTLHRPAGKGRHYYQPDFGEALYFAGEDICYLEYGARARVVCHAADGVCAVSLAAPIEDQLWLGTHPLLTLPLLEMLKRRGRFGIHAACLAVEGRGIMLAGTSGAGKSTLTLGLLRAGFDFLGDDLAFLDATGSKVLAFPEKIDLTEQTMTFFPELTAWTERPRRHGWPKYSVAAAELFGAKIEWSAIPGVIVLPEVAEDGVSRLTAVSGSEAFLRLAPSVLLTESGSTAAHLAALGALTDRVPAYRLRTGRDFDKVAAMLRELLQ